MVKEFRTAFRVSQNDMALYLGISRSHLSMIEMRQRTLTTKQVQELAKFQDTIHAVPQKGHPAHKDLLLLRETQKAKKEKMLEREISIHRYKLETTRRRITKLLEDQAQCENIFGQLDNLYAIANKQDNKIISIIHHQTKKLQGQTGEDSLLKLKMQEIGIEAVLKFLENELNPVEMIIEEKIEEAAKAKPKKKQKKNNADRGPQLSLL